MVGSINQMLITWRTNDGLDLTGEEWVVIIVLISVPAIVVLAVVFGMMLAASNRMPSGITIKMLGLTLSFKAGCNHFDPSTESGCRLSDEVFKETSEIITKEEGADAMDNHSNNGRGVPIREK